MRKVKGLVFDRYVVSLGAVFGVFCFWFSFFRGRLRFFFLLLFGRRYYFLVGFGFEFVLKYLEFVFEVFLSYFWIEVRVVLERRLCGLMRFFGYFEFCRRV